MAIVGTRYPTEEGSRFAEALSHDLARAGVAVFSGGAKGIDTAAHVGALRAGGATVVMAPAGFDRPFPERNAPLFERIVAEGGAYVSLLADDEPATPVSFFPRNACLVALAHVLVVVEAGFRSGARNAARWARALARPLLVVPHSPWKEKGRGCLLELRGGALLCEGPHDVLRELDRMLLQRLPRHGMPIQPNLPFDDTMPGPLAESPSVVAAIRQGAGHLDQIRELTGLSTAAIQRQILTLTLDGVLAPDPTGRLVLRYAPRPPVDSASESIEITREIEEGHSWASCAILNKPET